MQDRVQVAHEYQGYLHLVFDGLQLREKQLHTHAVLQGLGGSTLDDGTVSQRVAERNAHLNHGNTTTLKGQNDVGCAVEGGTSGTEI